MPDSIGSKEGSGVNDEDNDDDNKDDEDEVVEEDEKSTGDINEAEDEEGPPFSKRKRGLCTATKTIIG